MKKIISLALALIMLLGVVGVMSSCGDAIIVHTNAFFAPFEYYDGDVIKGVDVEIMALVGEKLGKEIKFHKFWDGSVIASQHYGCSPLSLAEELDRATDAEREELMSGTPDNWHDDATKYSQEAYALIVNSKVADEKYMERAYEMVNYLVPTAGYRLAKILNTIFDK